MLGDMEDITNRKQLATAARYIKMSKVWLEDHTVTLDKKVQRFDSLGTSVLLYNSSCLGLRKADSESIDSFHRKHNLQ